MDTPALSPRDILLTLPNGLKLSKVRVPLGEIPGPSLIFKDDALPKTELLVGITMH